MIHGVASALMPAEMIGPPMIMNPMGTVFTVGQVLSYLPIVSGGVPAMSFAIQGGALGLGVSLNAVTGALTGTLLLGSLLGRKLRVTDARGLYSEIDINLTVSV